MSGIEEVKSRTDIVELISTYVPLKKAGRNLKGLCPFHQEKTPSFIVFPDSQHFRCFGCGANGDAFGFLMQIENIEFGEALRILAQRAGIVLRPPTEQEVESDRRRSRLQELNLATAQYFHHQLRYGDAGAMPRAYLEKRGMSEETVQAFLLGYAPDRWDGLVAYLRERGYSESEMLDGGVVTERESGGVYDRFRHRLIFPIRDMGGHVVGFGGRALDDEQTPKYLNSPQTPLFDKGSLLYGLDQAGAAVRREGRVILVEGYFDVLMAHQAGYKNVVAPMGTALTPMQVQLLKRMTHTLYLALDADTAGAMAMLRGMEVIREAMDEKSVPVPTPRGLVRFERELDGQVRIVVLPPGMDPDEVILAGRELWEERIAAALPVVDFVLDRLAAEADLKTAKGKAQAVQEVLPLLTEIHNPVERAHYVQRLAHLVQVDERAIAAQLQPATPARPQSRPRRQAAKLPVEEPPADEGRAFVRKEEVDEGHLVALLYRFPHLGQALPVGTDSLLSQEAHRVLLGLLQSQPQPDMEALPGELRAYLEGLLNRFQGDLGTDETTAHQDLLKCLKGLEVLANKRLHHEYTEVLVQAREEGDFALADDMGRRLSELDGRLVAATTPPRRRLYNLDLRRHLGEDGEEPTPKY